MAHVPRRQSRGSSASLAGREGLGRGVATGHSQLTPPNDPGGGAARSAGQAAGEECRPGARPPGAFGRRRAPSRVLPGPVPPPRLPPFGTSAGACRRSAGKPASAAVPGAGLRRPPSAPGMGAATGRARRALGAVAARRLHRATGSARGVPPPGRGGPGAGTPDPATS